MSFFGNSVDPPEVDDKWPNYSTFNPGPPKHLHAVGVIASCYNSFERILFDLYLHHLNRNKVPKQLSAQFFLSRDQSRRLTLINEVFSAYEKRQKVKDRIVNLTEYFTWASEIRNMLLHAEVYPTLLRDDIAFNIIKRKGRYTLDSGYQSFGLLQLRDYADKIQEGRLQAAKIAVHLRYRDTKPQYRSGALQRHGLEPFPRKLDLPEMPQLWESPHAGPTPQPQRRQRARKHR